MQHVIGRGEPAGGGPIATRPEAAQPGIHEVARDQLGPAVRNLLDEHGLDPGLIPGTGKGGRVTKGDVLAYLESAPEPRAAAATARRWPSIAAP